MKGRKKWVALAVAVMLVMPLAVWASDRFEDVPDSNVFHDDISWLADSGVTFGCNPPDNTQFCPSDNVTREQMAAFMRRLSEGQVVDAATSLEADHAAEADHATDADTVAGLTPEQIAFGWGDTGPFGAVESLTASTNIALEEVSINAPGDGHLQVSGSLSILDNQENTALVWVQLDNSACDNDQASVSSIGFGYASTSSLSARGGSALAQGIIPVDEGPHTITLCAREFAGGNAPSVYGPRINVLHLANAVTSPGVNTSSSGEIPGADG